VRNKDLTAAAALAAIAAAAEDLVHFPEAPHLEPPEPVEHAPKKLRKDLNVTAREIKVKNRKARIWNRGKGKR
jgi:hypothetical protein